MNNQLETIKSNIDNNHKFKHGSDLLKNVCLDKLSDSQIDDLSKFVDVTKLNKAIKLHKTLSIKYK